MNRFQCTLRSCSLLQLCLNHTDVMITDCWSPVGLALHLHPWAELKWSRICPFHFYQDCILHNGSRVFAPAGLDQQTRENHTHECLAKTARINDVTSFRGRRSSVSRSEHRTRNPATTHSMVCHAFRFQAGAYDALLVVNTSEDRHTTFNYQAGYIFVCFLVCLSVSKVTSKVMKRL